MTRAAARPNGSLCSGSSSSSSHPPSTSRLVTAWDQGTQRVVSGTVPSLLLAALHTPHPTCWTENTRYLDLIKHKITYSVSVDTDECKKYSAVCVREAVSRQCSVQFIFISGGNNNYQMKNEDSRDNDCNDRIMTRC